MNNFKVGDQWYNTSTGNDCMFDNNFEKHQHGHKNKCFSVKIHVEILSFGYSEKIVLCYILMEK